MTQDSMNCARQIFLNGPCGSADYYNILASVTEKLMYPIDKKCHLNRAGEAATPNSAASAGTSAASAGAPAPNNNDVNKNQVQNRGNDAGGSSHLPSKDKNSKTTKNFSNYFLIFGIILIKFFM